MPRCMPFRRVFYSLSVVLLVAGAAFAQFTASIQGVVQDQSGASVPKDDPISKRRDGCHHNCHQ